ncbi:hypothetical protein FRB90_012460 [Tulasnella sp. 427]|nr:hypothetical protein FRB90_012460 [Tulasnella sp. 427]
MSSPTLPSPPSDKEASFYYAGLPSRPRLVARTGTTQWREPTGVEAWSVSVVRELRAVGSHDALQEIWEDSLAPKVHALLDSMRVKWTSIDVVRIPLSEEPSGPVILWIGVMPSSLSGHEGVDVAFKCRELLIQDGIVDVDVEIRDSVVTRLAGPKLLPSVYSFNPTVDIREPLTSTLGLSISTQDTPWAEGTGGFFLNEDGKPDTLLLVTTRHVVFRQGESNELFENKTDSQPRYVTLFGNAGFDKYLESIRTKIRQMEYEADYHYRCMEAAEGRDASMEREEDQTDLEKAKKAIEALGTFYQQVSADWATLDSRVLGHVILSPPISVSSEGYTVDWAVIEIDASKIDKGNFKGNAIDLGTLIPVGEFVRMICPNYMNDRTFKYPAFRNLKLQGTIPYDEMRSPRALDQYGKPCLMVVKRGYGSGLTVGRANNFFSYVRSYMDDGSVQTSKEWAILPRDSKSRSFAEQGDSGSVIVDGSGRIGGLLTGGAGDPDDLDITYATPIDFLLKSMEQNGLYKPNINPCLDSTRT